MAQREKSGCGVSLLISMLTRYPEVARVNFGPDEIRLVFLLGGVLSREALEDLRHKLDEHLRVFGWLRGQDIRAINLEAWSDEGVTILELRRDLESISLEEMNMVVELMRGEAGEMLLTDERSMADEDDLRWQEEMIEEMLEDVRLTRQSQRLCAHREGGKVFVFNEKGK